MADIIKVTGTTLSATTGTQFVPFDTTRFFNGSVFALSGTSAVNTISAGPIRVEASVKVNPADKVNQELILDVRQAGVTVASAGFGELDSINMRWIHGGEIWDPDKATYEGVESLTLGGSTIVSATANDQIGVYLTGRVESATVTATLTLENLN